MLSWRYLEYLQSLVHSNELIQSFEADRQRSPRTKLGACAIMASISIYLHIHCHDRSRLSEPSSIFSQSELDAPVWLSSIDVDLLESPVSCAPGLIGSNSGARPTLLLLLLRIINVITILVVVHTQGNVVHKVGIILNLHLGLLGSGSLGQLGRLLRGPKSQGAIVVLLEVTGGTLSTLVPCN